MCVIEWLVSACTCELHAIVAESGERRAMHTAQCCLAHTEVYLPTYIRTLHTYAA